MYRKVQGPLVVSIRDIFSYADFIKLKVSSVILHFRHSWHSLSILDD